MSDTAAALKPNRDFPTRVAYAQLAAFGWFVFGMGPSMQFLREDLGLTRTVLSLHNIAGSIGSIGAGLFTAAIIRKVGRGQLSRWASIALVVGIALYLGPTVLFTLPGAFLCGFAGITILQCNSSFLNSHQRLAAPASISEVNALAAGIGLVSPIVIGAFVKADIGWRSGIAIGAVALVIVEIWRGRNVTAWGAPRNDEEHDENHDVPGKMPTSFWWACFALAFTTACEASVLTWGPELLRLQAGFTPATATQALGLVVGAMGLGRWYGSVLMAKFDVEKIYRFALLGALITFIVVWTSHNKALSLAFLFIFGAMISVHFPLGITRLMRASHGRPDKGTANSSIASGIAAGFAPFLVAAFGDLTSITAAFVVVPIVLASALLFAVRHPVPLLNKN